MKSIIKATRSDKPKVLEILTEAFWDDPHINWFTGNGLKNYPNNRKQADYIDVTCASRLPSCLSAYRSRKS